MSQGKKHEPSEEQRAQVSVMAQYGINEEQIASYIGVTAKTLRKHYRGEIDQGKIGANLKVAKSLFGMANNGNVAAAIFWLKTQAGWTETIRVGGEGGGPIKTEATIDASKLSTEVLKAIRNATKPETE